MKRSNLLRGIAACATVGALLEGCMVREPAPVCPVPIQATSETLAVGGYQGVDMIVVVDNSPSMVEEQQILSTGFFTLINALVNPVDGKAPADDVRVAIVTSDLGTQHNRIPGPALSAQSTPTGDDGAFFTYPMGTTIEIDSGVIACDQSASQCPTPQWSCTNGVCQAPVGSEGSVSCPGLGSNYAELLPGQSNGQLALQTACLAQVGKDGCGYEQQLEASVLGLEKHPDFMRDNYLLAVLVVSDEEDCSVRDGGLWNSESFKDNVLNNVSCNYPASNEEKYLYATDRYKKTLGALKKDERAVVFAAIVGVPTEASAGCQGKGSDLKGCLDDPRMELIVKRNGFKDEKDQTYTHFATACVRDDDPTAPGKETEARPGRRYVKVAQEFGDAGYVYSICNPDWSPAMNAFASMIEERMPGACYASALDWDPEAQVARCDVVVQLDAGLAAEDCPSTIVEAWCQASGGTAEDYRSAVLASSQQDSEGALLVGCPLPKIPTPLDCAAANEVLAQAQGRIGWYYCENSNPTEPDACGYKVELTELTKEAVRGTHLEVQCLQQFSFEDVNCQETGANACQNGEDDDGNGAYDCWSDFAGTDPHRADAHCCPVEVETGEGGTVCRVTVDEIAEICGQTTPSGQPLSATAYPDACQRAAADLGCTLIVE